MSTTVRHTRVTLLLAVTLGATAGPVHAEQNRLLPFWGQPFPSGFTRGEVVDPPPGLRCFPPAARRHHGRAYPSGTGRCRPVLHARG